ncbi:MAG: iron-containing redox enzyme family protein, partial [Proteobacteria bacterium]
RWFVTQEIGGEAGFDDLVAWTQVGFADRPKLEMARNYWDEMGRGHAKGMHGPMLQDAATELQVQADPRTTVWQALALSNLMAGLAYNRHYAFHSVGALGVVEMTAPGRVSMVNEGMRRLGVSALGRRYFQVHAALDVKHSEEWNREVLRPLVEADPSCARALAAGALLRLQAGQRCFARYRQHLGVSS